MASDDFKDTMLHDFKTIEKIVFLDGPNVATSISQPFQRHEMTGCFRIFLPKYFDPSVQSEVPVNVVGFVSIPLWDAGMIQEDFKGHPDATGAGRRVCPE